MKKIRKSFLYSKGGQTLAQVEQKGHEVSILGDNQHPTRHGPDQPAVAEPA